MANLTMGDGSAWRFTNAVWAETANGDIGVPEEHLRKPGPGLEGWHFAFHTAASFRDLTIGFEFRHNGFSDVGIVLRAQDQSHFHLLHFPYVGQANNTQNMWVSLSRMDESGYLRAVKCELVRREPANRETWHSVELILTGSRLRVRIGRNGLFEAEDSSMPAAGCIGLGLFNAANIRNVTVDGTPEHASVWSDVARQPTNWFHPEPRSIGGRWQKPQDLLKLPDESLLLSYVAQGNDYQGEDASLAGGVKALTISSTDGGRSWSQPEEMFVGNVKDIWFAPRLHVTPKGRLIGLSQSEGKWLAAESSDGGRRWPEPERLAIGAVPHGYDRLYIGPQAFLNLADGGMLLLAYCQETHEAVNVRKWGSLHGTAFCSRSADDGHTWSPWVNLDNSAKLGVEGQEGNLDLSEVCAVQAADGGIMALIRPFYSPWMWETWSWDGGRTWGPCARGPFPGYATPNLLRTSSGAILAAARLPGLTIHTSLDDGCTWDAGTMIDSSIWAMGAMVEVEPDVVLYVYYNSFETLMRAQLVRVTPQRLEPVRI